MLKKLSGKINFSKISGRDWVIFTLSLLLAFSIWLIHNLSLNYTEFLRVPVIAKSKLVGHSELSSNKVDIIARCRTSGFDIIKNSLFQKQNPIYLELNPSVLKSKSSEEYYITSNDLSEYTHLIYGNVISLDYFVNDTIFFQFPLETYKKLPVHPKMLISLKEQYVQKGEIQIEPDSVIVYAEPKILDKISFINTELIEQSDVDESISGIVGLTKNSRLRYSSNQFRYSLDIYRAVEIPLSVKVHTKNVPSDKKLFVFPSTANVILKCRFPITSNDFSNLRFYIDYNDYENSLSDKCILKVDGLSDEVLDYESEPLFFDCLVSEIN